MKYLPDDKYVDCRDSMMPLLDKLQAFIMQDGNQQSIVEDVVAICDQKGAVYKNTLASIFRDKTTLLEGMKAFLAQNSPDVTASCQQYGFKVADILELLQANLQGEIWQWTEDDVVERLSLLLQDIRLVGIVNGLLGTRNKTVERTREDLTKPFKFMKVPGSVYVNLNAQWSPAVHALHEVSLSKWVSYSLEEKQRIIAVLEKYAQEAWNHIQSPKEVLVSYMKQQQFSLTDDEITKILARLPAESYEYTEGSFRSSVSSICRDLEYAKKVDEISILWQSTSKCATVSEWCNANGLPIVWLLPEYADTFQILRQLEMKERVDQSRLEAAVSEISQGQFGTVSDRSAVYKCLVDNVASSEYYELLSPESESLVRHLKENVSIDVYTWANRNSDLRRETRKYVKTHLRGQLITEAQSRLNSLTEQQLRKHLSSLAEDSPDICLMILKDL
jgi:predicted house-cleaning noncanonical NTP pyrophosphatase (MazG superfamily)